MRQNPRRAAAALALAAAVCQQAAACPVCDSQRAVEVRAGIREEASPANIAAAVAPFILLGGLVAFVHFGARNAGPRTRASTRDEQDARS